MLHVSEISMIHKICRGRSNASSIIFPSSHLISILPWQITLLQAFMQRILNILRNASLVQVQLIWKSIKSKLSSSKLTQSEMIRQRPIWESLSPQVAILTATRCISPVIIKTHHFPIAHMRWFMGFYEKFL